jgi:hypothetical protein
MDEGRQSEGEQQPACLPPVSLAAAPPQPAGPQQRHTADQQGATHERSINLHAPIRDPFAADASQPCAWRSENLVPSAGAPLADGAVAGQARQP